MTKLSCATLSFVSVVKIAVANASALSAPLPSAAFAMGTAATSFSTGSGTPIIPVDEGKISSNTHPNASATATQLLWQASIPGSPVAQLALPAFTITALTLPPVAARCLPPPVMGAATTWLLVYITPASAGVSQADNARSGLPLALMPARTADQRNPSGRGSEIKEDLMSSFTQITLPSPAYTRPIRVGCVRGDIRFARPQRETDIM